MKLFRYLDNSTKNMIPSYRNILFNRYKDMSFWKLPPKFQFTKLLLNFVTKYAYFLHEIIF